MSEPNWMFKKLTDEEIEQYRQWARENYKPGDMVQRLWHPAVRCECELMNVLAVQAQEVAVS